VTSGSMAPPSLDCTPIGWDDLPTLKGAAHWTIKTARDHLSLRTVDPWVNFASSRQSLATALRQLRRVRKAAPLPRTRADR
jgi:DNA primase